MPDVRINMGTAEVRPTVGLHLDSGIPLTALPGPNFDENLVTFDVGDYVVVDGVPVADSEGARFDTTTSLGVAPTVLLTPPNPLTLLPGAYAHWVPGTTHFTNDSGFYRWWPVGGTRDGNSPRMSLFKQNRDPNSDGTMPYGDGVGAPTVLNSYTYQGFGKQQVRPAVSFESRGYAKIDPAASFSSATLAITAVFHASDLPWYGLLETTGANPLKLTWNHGQLELFYRNQRIFKHMSHRQIGAEALTVLVSLDAVNDVGRFYVLDANRTTRTFDIAGLDAFGMLGIFGGLGQGVVGNQYGLTADMDVLDVALWNRAMDWPEMESTVNLLALAYGVIA